MPTYWRRRSRFSKVGLLGAGVSGGSNIEGGLKLRRMSRIALLLLLGGLTATNSFADKLNTSQAEQDMQVIEMSAKKYEFSPSPVHVKAGTKVQLRITALDRAHGFKINLNPDGSDQKSNPGLIFSSNEDCFKLEKGIATVVQFVARTPGTYSFHCCNRCGLGHGGMKGQLVVEP
jgi:plastocyanin